MSARRWKEARRSRAAERDASGGARLRQGYGGSAVARAEQRASEGWRAPRAPENAGLRLVIMTAAAVITLGSSSVFACPVCFGAEESSMIDGTRFLIAVLLAITLGVQGAFAGFFFYLRKRAKRIADVDLDDEWSELQRASKTS